MLVQIAVDGVEQSKREIAETEIRQTLDTFFSDAENPVELVRVAERFQETVQTMLKGNEAAYDPHHDYGTACGHTISHIKNGKLIFAIVLDGSVIGKWLDSERLNRMAFLVHELVHVADDTLRWSEIGTDAFLAQPTGKSAWLFHNSLVIWQEYDAERTVGEIIQETAKEIGGKINFGYKPGNVQSLKTLLDDLHHYIKESIAKYRIWELDSEEICKKVTSRIMGILMLCAYTYALVDVSGEIKAKMAEIENLEGYQFALSNSWPRIHSNLRELYKVRGKYVTELIDKIASEVDAIVQVCGIEITDANGSFQVTVHDIK